MLPAPDICIVFNSGAAGDFFTNLLTNVLLQTNGIKVDNNGAVIDPPGQSFKMAASEFFINNFNEIYFKNLKNEPIVSTHYCHQELLDLFPQCKFYYLDDTDFVKITTETYIRKRLSNMPLKNYFSGKRIKLNDEKIKHFTDDQIKKIIQNDWNKNLNLWKQLKIKRIDLRDILNKDTCWEVVQDLLDKVCDKKIFVSNFEEWANYNNELIDLILK